MLVLEMVFKRACLCLSGRAPLEDDAVKENEAKLLVEAEEEARRRAMKKAEEAEEAMKKKKAEEEEAKKWAEEEARKAEEEELEKKRKAEEEEAKRRAEEDCARKKKAAEEEARKKAAATSPASLRKSRHETHLSRIKEVTDAWDREHVQATVHGVFAECDRQRDEVLQWNNCEIRHFVNLVFKEHGLEVPVHEEARWYELYRSLDQDRNYGLDFEECVQFAKALHEDCLKRGGSWIGKKGPEEAEGAGAAPTSSSSHAAELERWDDPAVQAKVQELFAKVDVNQDGRLSWNECEVRDFIKRVFAAHGLPTPRLPEMVWYQLYREVDVDGSLSMSRDEARRFARHVYERVLDTYPEAIAEPAAEQES